MPGTPDLSLTIYRGTTEIGGNCVELRAGPTRIVVDVGVPLIDSRGELFDTRSLKGKSKQSLLDEGILPNVPGLFRGDLHPDAILLSHAHLDHSGFLGQTQPRIPVYASEGTSKMMLAGSVFANGEEIPKKRFRKLQPGRPKTIGDFRVTTFPVDHSVYGSSAFLIEAGKKTVLYSGDLRLHGRNPEMAEQLLKALKNQTMDALLMEGTHLGGSRRQRVTEHNLDEQISEQVQRAEGLALVSFSPQHVDRLMGFLNAAKNAGRTFVADAYTAFVIYLVHRQLDLVDPSADEEIRVFYPYYFARKRRSKLHDMFRPRQITLDEIRQNPSDFLMMFRPSMLDSDFHGKLPDGATVLYSQWEGYLDRQDWQETERRLAASGGKLVPVHTSGHILEEDMVRFVREIDPRVVIPIHTLRPERLGDLCERVHRLENGQAYEVG
ncbi:MAG: MBL fold metallo-hydrolase [Pirellulales bacterium]|nr:MBL fold metallo-hydrolase [Pirellulales bacterium]